MNREENTNKHVLSPVNAGQGVVGGSGAGMKNPFARFQKSSQGYVQESGRTELVDRTTVVVIQPGNGPVVYKDEDKAALMLSSVLGSGPAKTISKVQNVVEPKSRGMVKKVVPKKAVQVSLASLHRKAQGKARPDRSREVVSVDPSMIKSYEFMKKWSMKANNDGAKAQVRHRSSPGHGGGAQVLPKPRDEVAIDCGPPTQHDEAIVNLSDAVVNDVEEINLVSEEEEEAEQEEMPATVATEPPVKHGASKVRPSTGIVLFDVFDEGSNLNEMYDEEGRYYDDYDDDGGGEYYKHDEEYYEDGEYDDGEEGKHPNDDQDVAAGHYPNHIRKHGEGKNPNVLEISDSLSGLPKLVKDKHGNLKPWWSKLPDFVPISELRGGKDPRDGSHIFIDYLGQFKGTKEPSLDKNAPSRKRKKVTEAKGGHWVSIDGDKCFVTESGDTLTGKAAYVAYSRSKKTTGGQKKPRKKKTRRRKKKPA